MAHRLFKGVLSIILLCVCFEECSPMGDEDFHLALKQATVFNDFFKGMPLTTMIR